MVQLLWKTMVFFKKLKIELLYDSAIPFQGLYPKELKEESQRFLHTHVHRSIVHSKGGSNLNVL